MNWQDTIFLIGAVSLLMLLIAYQSIGFHLRKKIAPTQVNTGVTVLKPLKGVDPGLEENLVAVLEQDHPQLEVIFGCEDPQDPALAIVECLKIRYPEKQIKVVLGGVGVGANPKVRILRTMIKEASNEWVLISDSNVRPAPDYVQAMLRVQKENNAELVHTVLSGQQGNSLGGRLEELQLNGWVAASICFAQRFGHPCVIGKSMLLRTRWLREEGALTSVQDILAEDYILGSRVHKEGGKVCLAPYRLPVVTGNAGISSFLNRHIRWGQMRRRIAPAWFFAELLVNPTPFFALSICLCDPPLRSWALGLLIFKWASDAIAYRLLSSRPSLRTLALIPLKDFLVLFMWCISALKRTIVWRGNRMWVGEGSRLWPAPEPFGRQIRNVLTRSLQRTAQFRQ